MSNQWNSVKGYEGLYEVSSKGLVRSLDRRVTRTVKGTFSSYCKKGRLMRQNKSGSNYTRVELCKESNRNKHYVHRLVAEAFIPNPENKPCVNHIDGNKMNNYVDNLEWCTHRFNNLHAKTMGLNKIEGENCHLSKLTRLEVLDICVYLDDLGLSYKQLANKYGVTSENISSIDRGKTWNSVTGRRKKTERAEEG